MLHALCASYVSFPVLQTAQTAYYPQPHPQAQPYDYYGQSYQYYGQQPVCAKYPAQLMYQGYEPHREEPPPPPLGIPPAPQVDEGGEIDFPLKKEEDEAEPSGGAPEAEAKLEEKVVQEAEHEALPEAKPEDKQQPADPREPPPARGEPLLTQKGPEADVTTGGGTGCGYVPSHALSPFRMFGSDVALGTGGSALRVRRVLRVSFMRVPGDIRRGLHVSRVLQNGCPRRRMKMTRNGTRTRYSGDRQCSQQGRLLRGTHCAAAHTQNRCNNTGKDDFVDKEWELEDVQNVADTRTVHGDKFGDSVHNAPSVSAEEGPA